MNNNKDVEKKAISDDTNIVLLSPASRIINSIKTDKSMGLYDMVSNTLDNNKHVKGLDINITNRIINRAYTLFCEILQDKSVNSDDIILHIIIACRVVENELIDVLYDKLNLVLIILRKYIEESIEESDKPMAHLFIESQAPIIIKQIMSHANSGKKKLCCWL